MDPERKLPGAQRFGEGNRLAGAGRGGARGRGLACGRRVRYDALVCTAPLDATLRLLGRGAWADGLTHRCPRPLQLLVHALGCREMLGF